MLLIGTYICSFMETISFLLTFLFLRSRTNGIHAKSYAQCFFLSILCELFFISLPTYISSFFLNLVRDLSVATIFIFAPYRHPLMHLNDTEVKACANDAKIRALILELLALLLSFCDIYDAYLGISLGIIMTAMLLVLAYGNIEEVKYEQ